MVIVTIGLFCINFYQAKTNRETLNLFAEQQKYSLIKPRLIVNRYLSRLSGDGRFFHIQVKNIGNSPACNISLVLERPTEQGKDYEFQEKWAYVNYWVLDTLGHRSFDEKYLFPAEGAEIKVRLIEMFAKELGGEANLKKLLLSPGLIFKAYLYYEDLEGKAFLTACKLGHHMKHRLTVLGESTAKALEKYGIKEGETWRIRFYEDVSLRDTSKKD